MVDEPLAEDAGKALDRAGIAAPAGRCCTQPILPRCGLEATFRPWLALYNRREYVEVRIAAAGRIAVPAHVRSRQE